MSSKNQAQPQKLKDVEMDINRMKNRIEKLKKKSRYEKISVEKNKSLADNIFSQKITLAEELMERNRQNSLRKSQQKVYLEELKAKNTKKRNHQKQQISNIMRAIYLVKVDDARQLKRLSNQHKDNLRNINSSLVDEKKKKIHSLRSEQGQKEKQYWRDKLQKLYKDNLADKEQNQEKVEERKGELQKLKKQEQKMIEYYSRIQNISAQSKRQYASALSIPLRQVASVLEMKSKTDSPDQGRKKVLYKKAKAYFEQKQQEYEEEQHFPKTQVNQAKLKIVLEVLKKRKQEEKKQ